MSELQLESLLAFEALLVLQVVLVAVLNDVDLRGLMAKVRNQDFPLQAANSFFRVRQVGVTEALLALLPLEVELSAVLNFAVDFVKSEDALVVYDDVGYAGKIRKVPADFWASGEVVRVGKEEVGDGEALLQGVHALGVAGLALRALPRFLGLQTERVDNGDALVVHQRPKSALDAAIIVRDVHLLQGLVDGVCLRFSRRALTGFDLRADEVRQVEAHFTFRALGRIAGRSEPSFDAVLNSKRSAFLLDQGVVVPLETALLVLRVSPDVGVEVVH